MDHFKNVKMDNTTMTERWLSVEEIAEYLGISKDTVYAWISKKGMPAHRVGRFWKFQRVEIDTWVKSGGADEGKVEDQD
ncbi:methylation-associated defense system helix-turn-helix domain-containing protein MAD1 [Duganella lactea]|uniref:methylation-associated defense system helix-turn-helix domain-containing protein MAD1 n=1 Tax=Duganella lactea TaxID=2692173 RepID=UPI003FCE89BF